MPWNELKMLRESAGLSQEALAKKNQHITTGTWKL